MASVKNEPLLTVSPYEATPFTPVRRLLQPADLWALTKQADELGGEWTFPIFQYRTYNFHFPDQPVGFYEPMADFERLMLEAYLYQRAAKFSPVGDDGDVAVVVHVFPSIFDAHDGVIRLPDDDEKTIGQHCFRVLGVEDETTLTVYTAWSGWSEGGVGYLSKEYFSRYATEAWMCRRWDRGPKASTAEHLFSTTDEFEFHRLWTQERRQGNVADHRAEGGAAVRWYECWSLHDQHPAEILTVQLNENLRVGVAVLIHPIEGDQPVSFLSDIYIWPTYRRNGYGSMLERAAAERSRLHGAERLGVNVYNADLVNGDARSKSFLASCGFTNIESSPDAQVAIYSERPIA